MRYNSVPGRRQMHAGALDAVVSGDVCSLEGRAAGCSFGMPGPSLAGTLWAQRGCQLEM